MRKIVAESGVSFDPKVVEILQRRYVELEAMAQERGGETAKLSTDVKVERGLEPAAGFENTKRPASSTDKPSDFLSSIAAARQEVQTLFELAQDLGNSLSLNETLSLLAMRLKRMIQYDSLAIYVLRGEKLRAEYVNGENFRLFSSLDIPLGQGLSGWVAENRKPIINGNPSVEPGYLSDETKFTTMRSALSVPLIGLNGTISVLTLYHNEKDAFTQDHLRILLAIVPKLALSIENALRFQQAQSSASTDYMTGLPNARSLFLHLDSELARCRRLNSPLIVLVCDMNGFKQINDKYGHLEGNRILHSVASKLKDSCREYDYVAPHGRRRVRLSSARLAARGAPTKSPAAEANHRGCRARDFRQRNDRAQHWTFRLPGRRHGCRSIVERSGPPHVHRQAEGKTECRGKARLRVRAHRHLVNAVCWSGWCSAKRAACCWSYC